MSDRDVKNQEHYTSGKSEPIEVMRYLGRKKECIFDFKSYCMGNMLKYLVRYPLKNGIEDLRKARVYGEFLFNFQEVRDIKTEVSVDLASKYTIELSHWNSNTPETLTEREFCMTNAIALAGESNPDQLYALRHVIYAMCNEEKAGFLIHLIDNLIQTEKKKQS